MKQRLVGIVGNREDWILDEKDYCNIKLQHVTLLMYQIRLHENWWCFVGLIAQVGAVIGLICAYKDLCK
jgi:hypothetical protein